MAAKKTKSEPADWKVKEIERFNNVPRDVRAAQLDRAADEMRRSSTRTHPMPACVLCEEVAPSAPQKEST